MSKIEAVICPSCGEMEKIGEQHMKIDQHAMETIKINQDSLNAVKKPCLKCSKPDTRS